MQLQPQLLNLARALRSNIGCCRPLWADHKQPWRTFLGPLHVTGVLRHALMPGERALQQQYGTSVNGVNLLPESQYLLAQLWLSSLSASFLFSYWTMEAL